MTEAEVEAVADVLSDPDNASLTAGEVAEKVLGALAALRRRPWRYVIIAQDRRRFYDLRARFGTYQRAFYPTYVKGPFTTLAEARAASGPIRRAGLKVMTAQVYGPDDQVDTSTLKEVLA